MIDALQGQRSAPPQDTPGALPGGQLAGVRQGAPAPRQPDGAGDAGGLGGLASAKTGRRGRPRAYSDIAIETGHLLRLAFGRPWRQTEGLLRSVTALLGVEVGIPDHTTFSRRRPGLPLADALAHAQRTGPVHVVLDATGLKVHGAGEWLAEIHGGLGKRTWRKLHLAVDPESGEILASEPTTTGEGDAALVGPLLDRLAGPIASVIADGAYDGEPVYRAVAERQPDPPAAVVIPPRATAVPSPTAGTAPTQRDRHIRMIRDRGRLGWQKAVGYGRRSLGETAVSRYKVINRMTRLGMPVSQRTARQTATAAAPRPSPDLCTNATLRQTDPN